MKFHRHTPFSCEYRNCIVRRRLSSRFCDLMTHLWTEGIDSAQIQILNESKKHSFSKELLLIYCKSSCWLRCKKLLTCNLDSINRRGFSWAKLNDSYCWFMFPESIADLASKKWVVLFCHKSRIVNRKRQKLHFNERSQRLEMWARSLQPLPSSYSKLAIN